MVLLLYRLGIGVYYFLLRIVALFNVRAKTFVKGRSLQPVTKPSHRIALPNLWIHCASHGEYETAKPIIKRYHATHSIHLTFYSPSGYQVAIQEKSYWDSLRYLPYDTQIKMEAIVSKINPSVVIFIQYEFWYFLLNVLDSKNIPFIYYGVSLRSDHLLTKPYARFIQKKVDKSKLILVRDDTSLAVAKSIFTTEIRNVGDVRWLQANSNRAHAFVNRLNTVSKDYIILGSAWANDVKLWAPIINKRNDLSFVIAPHDISNNNVDLIRDIVGAKCLLYSKMSNHIDLSTDCHTVIIDTLGDLKYLYRDASIAYIGGGLGDGLHNCIEAAVFAKYLLISGKIIINAEAVSLIENGYATQVSTTGEIEIALTKHLGRPQPQRYESYIAAEIEKSEQALSLLDKEIYV